MNKVRWGILSTANIATTKVNATPLGAVTQVVVFQPLTNTAAMKIEPHDLCQHRRRPYVHRQLSKRLAELVLEAFQRRVIEQQRDHAMAACQQPADHQPALAHKEVAAPQELSVRYVPVVVQARVVDLADRNHRHMEVSAGKLGRLVVVIAEKE